VSRAVLDAKIPHVEDDLGIRSGHELVAPVVVRARRCRGNQHA
jgi:hypothetical protein